MQHVDYGYRHRVFVGLCVALHVPFVLAMIVMSPVLVGRMAEAGDADLARALGEALALLGELYFTYTAISGLAAALLGLPIVLTLRRLSLEFWWCLAAAGALVGVAAGVGLGYLTASETGPLPERVFSRGTGLAAVVGALSGLAFWYVVYRRAPADSPG